MSTSTPAAPASYPIPAAVLQLAAHLTDRHEPRWRFDSVRVDVPAAGHVRWVALDGRKAGMFTDRSPAAGWLAAQLERIGVASCGALIPAARLNELPKTARATREIVEVREISTGSGHLTVGIGLSVGRKGPDTVAVDWVCDAADNGNLRKFPSTEKLWTRAPRPDQRVVTVDVNPLLLLDALNSVFTTPNLKDEHRLQIKLYVDADLEVRNQLELTGACLDSHAGPSWESKAIVMPCKDEKPEGLPAIALPEGFPHEAWESLRPILERQGGLSAHYASEIDAWFQPRYALAATEEGRQARSLAATHE